MNQKENILQYTKINKNINQKVFKLTPKEENTIRQEILYYEDKRSVIIEALKIIQKNYGWISDESIETLSIFLNIPSSEIEGIATFYSYIFRKPVGRNIIRYCDSIVCYITGYQKIKAELEKLLFIKPGETTIDKRFTLLPTCCLGKCDQSPVIMINENTHIRLIPEMINSLLEQYI